MCNSCSTFLPYEIAKSIVTSVYTLNKGDTTIKNDMDSIRICNHCMGLLETRRRVQISQIEKPLICQMYEQLHKVKCELEPLVDLYKKMYDSIMDGDSKYSLQDAQSLRASIAKHAEQLDIISKRILNIPEDETNLKIQAAIRQATYQYIKEYVLNQPVLPTPAEIEKIKKGRSYRVTEVHQPLGIPKIRKVAVTTGWSPDNASENNVPDVSDDPLLQQMNIVRNYIQQARKANRFEEVASLEENLKMLKETYMSQQKRNAGSRNESVGQE
ncbi:rabenosyn-5-like isoform X2 [Agrilus planipennis]|nr:rabenosyn-5-like isoform X2 [Agrilus planipennis]